MIPISPKCSRIFGPKFDFLTFAWAKPWVHHKMKIRQLNKFQKSKWRCLLSITWGMHMTHKLWVITWDFEEFGIGLFSGAWAFNGWNKLNYIIEEIKEPEKNLLIAVVGSLGMVSIFYMLVNLSYFAVLGIEGKSFLKILQDQWFLKIRKSLWDIQAV